MERRRLRLINAELNNRNVGLWIDVKQDRPGAVVDAPTIVAAHRCRCKQLLNALSKVGITRRGILYLIQLARKAPEVMDRPWRSAHGNGCIFYIPMSGDGKYGLRPRQCRTNA